MRRAITLVLSFAALSGCGALPSMPSLSLPSLKMPSFSGGSASGTPVHVTSVPAGAEASFGKESCTTPCTLDAPNGAGSYNVSFKLNGYQPQSVPVRIAVNESSSMQSGDSGVTPTTVITPDPVMAELTALKPPAARTKAKPMTTSAATAPPPAARLKAKPTTTTAEISARPPISSPPPATATAETSTQPPASSPPSLATTTAETSAPPSASSPSPTAMTTAAISFSPPPPATTTAETSAPPSADSPVRKGKPGVWDTVSRWWNER